MIPVGTRVIRAGYPLDPYHGIKGTVVGHNYNIPNQVKQKGRALRYNVVDFDQPGRDGKTPDNIQWVEGHLGIVPLGAVDLLGELA